MISFVLYWLMLLFVFCLIFRIYFDLIMLVFFGGGINFYVLLLINELYLVFKVFFYFFEFLLFKVFFMDCGFLFLVVNDFEMKYFLG